jgi:hypothetical protein
MAQKKSDDPSVRYLKGGAPEYPEGTHPLVPPSEQTWGPNRFKYSDLDDDLKPDETSVISQVEEDPIVEETQKVLRDDAKKGFENTQKERAEQEKSLKGGS